MVDLIKGLRADQVRANLERVRSAIADTGRDPEHVEILAAVWVGMRWQQVGAHATLRIGGHAHLRALVRLGDGHLLR